MIFELPFEEKGIRTVSARTEEGDVLSITFTDGIGKVDDAIGTQLCDLLPNLKKCRTKGPKKKKSDDAVIHTESSDNTEEGE